MRMRGAAVGCCCWLLALLLLALLARAARADCFSDAQLARLNATAAECGAAANCSLCAVAQAADCDVAVRCHLLRPTDSSASAGDESESGFVELASADAQNATATADFWTQVASTNRL